MARKRGRRDANADRHPSLRVSYRPRVHAAPSPRPTARVGSSRLLGPLGPPADDHRLWHPSGPARPVVSYSGTRATKKRLVDRPRLFKGHSRVKARAAKRQAVVNRFGPEVFSQTKAVVAFADPGRIPLCVKRQVRKRVIHARGFAGGRVRPPRRTENSGISCRGS